MAYANDDDLTTRVPSTAALTLAQRETALSDARSMIDDGLFGDKAIMAHVAYAAHLLQLRGLLAGGEGGLVTARSAGSISVSYAAGGGDFDPLLGSTRFGREYLMIVRTVPHVPIGVFEDA